MTSVGRRLPTLLLAASLACLGLGTWATVVTPHRASAGTVARECIFALSWIAVGAVAIWLGRSRIATRILTLALVLSADFTGSFALLSQTPYARLIETATVVLVPFQTPVAGHLLLAYPSGRLDDSTARRIVGAGYGLGAVDSLVWALGHVKPACPECATAYTHVGLPIPLTRGLLGATTILWFILAVAFIVQVLRQFRSAGARQRRLLRLPYLAILVTAAFYSVLLVIGGLRNRSPWGLDPAALIAMQVVALLGVPLSFLVGLLRERLSYKQVGDFLVASAAAPDMDLERAMGAAVGDPGLRIAFPVDGGFVDPTGSPVPAPRRGARTEVTVVGPEAAPLAVVTHDRSLADEPALLTAAGSAARLLLENARLQAEVRAQLLEVRESRSRIVEAANEARVRLERDLHDGAQQRLLAIGLALNLLETRPGDEEILRNAREEVTGALAELRALAAGIHPSVLTDLGLLAALDGLAQRIGGLVTVEAPAGDPGRQPAPVEAAAYFATAEAVTNALKHASATRVTVVIRQEKGRLLLSVEDDGVGGADAHGRGLLGIRDRLASVGGTLTVETATGAGTRLAMELPVIHGDGGPR